MPLDHRDRGSRDRRRVADVLTEGDVVGDERVAGGVVREPHPVPLLHLREVLLPLRRGRHRLPRRVEPADAPRLDPVEPRPRRAVHHERAVGVADHVALRPLDEEDAVLRPVALGVSRHALDLRGPAAAEEPEDGAEEISGSRTVLHHVVEQELHGTDLRDLDRAARDRLLVERADGLRLLVGEVAVARFRAPPRERLESPERDVPRRRGVEGCDIGADRGDREVVVESAVRGAGRAHPSEDVPLGDGEGRVLAVVEPLEVGSERGVRRHLDELRPRLLRLEREPLVRHHGEALGLPVLLEERERGAGVRDLPGGEREA